MTELEFYQTFVKAWLASGFDGQTTPTTPTMPGYKTGPPKQVSVDNATIGAGTGFTPFKSLVTVLDETAGELAGAQLTQNLSEQQVAGILTGKAFGQCAYLGKADPDCGRQPDLIIQYAKAYRVAVTPVSAPATNVQVITGVVDPLPSTSVQLVGSFRGNNAKGQKVFNPGPGANDQTVHDGDKITQGGLNFVASVVTGPLGLPEITFIQQ